MELVRCTAEEGSRFYKKGALVGVDLVPNQCSDEEMSFCESFPEKFKKGKALVRFEESKNKKQYVLIFDYINSKIPESRVFEMGKNKRLLQLLLSNDYEIKVCFENGGYNALKVRFIGGKSQTRLNV
ncbi:MAG: hypothetical protein WC470_00500 [Candidatus Paceibacterota bacterium]